MKSLHEEGGLASGMTLRDYFAAQCMASLASGFHSNDGDFVDEDAYDLLASAAYDMADAMLTARKEQR